MAEKREERLRENEEHARRTLEGHARRWPSNPNVFYILLAAVLVVIALIAL